MPRLATLAAIACALAVLAPHAPPAATAAQPAVAPLALPTQLVLRPAVMIDGDVVRLADLFDGDVGATGLDPDMPVAYAPPPGRRAILDAEWLGRLAYRLRLPWRPATRMDRAVVERSSTAVGAGEIESALRAELDRRGEGRDRELQIGNRTLVVNIPADKPGTVEVTDLRLDPDGERFTAIIAVPAGDPQAVRQSVQGRLFSVVEVPVPVVALRPGETVAAKDIAWARVRADWVRNNTVAEMADLVGMEVRRPLRAGAPVRREDVRAPVMVARGATVTMLYRTANMTLSVVGRALSAGGQDEVIQVANVQTNTVVDARILGPDRVAAITPDQLAQNAAGATR
ncbi:MAG: flagellar basal body P-ring formation chaperone FlgA [Alphaproteobacteria bacterium]